MWNMGPGLAAVDSGGEAKLPLASVEEDSLSLRVAMRVGALPVVDYGGELGLSAFMVVYAFFLGVVFCANFTTVSCVCVCFRRLCYSSRDVLFSEKLCTAIGLGTHMAIRRVCV